ncbi:hypothetical protein JFU03_10475 [Bacillus sp. TH44]|nr:hypothetical protein [Bacillus sp. TH44]
MHKVIYGILILIYTLYSFFVSDGSEVGFIMVLTIVLIFSVVLEKEMQTKRLIKGLFVCIFLIGYYSPDVLGIAPNRHQA